MTVIRLTDGLRRRVAGLGHDIGQLVCDRAASRASGASTITRTSGSVPLGRTSTRPVVAELGLGGGDLARDASSAIGSIATRDRHVDAAPGQPGHDGAASVGERPPGARHDVEHLQAGQQAVAGGGEVAEDDVAGLLAAER